MVFNVGDKTIMVKDMIKKKSAMILRRVLISFLILIITMCSSVIVFAHQGRTDSSGGHRDNKNKSGLGSYHYHCGEYSAHLHNGGVCPYNSSTDITYENKVDVINIYNAPTELYVDDNFTVNYDVSFSNTYGSKSWSSSDYNVA